MMVSLKNECIAQLLPTFQSGGAERTALDVGKAIITAGGKAIIISSGGRLVEKAVENGITHITLPLQSKNPLQMLKNYFSLKTIFKRQGVTLVHARSRAPAWSGYYAAKALNLPFITTFHGLYGSSSTLKRFYNAIMVKGDKVIANSDFTKDFIVKNYGNSEKIVTINRGVDKLEFNPEIVTKKRLEALNFPKNQPILFLPSRLAPNKGHSQAIEALSLLKEKPILLIAGDGEERGGVDDIKQRIKALNLEAQVVFAGHIADMPAAYLLSTLVLVPAVKPEGFGRIAIETGAMGIPSIVNPLGAMRETVIDGKTGWHVDVNNASSFANAISHALSLTREQRQAMGAVAKNHILTNYELEKMINSTLNVYLNVLSKNLN